MMWIYLGIWGLGSLLTWRPTLRAVRRELIDLYPNLPVEWEDVAAIICFGTLLALIWPLWFLQVSLVVQLKRHTGNNDRARSVLDAITGRTHSE